MMTILEDNACSATPTIQLQMKQLLDYKKKAKSVDM